MIWLVFAAVEAAGIVSAVALCRAAAKRPIYGPPIGGTES